MEEQQGDIVTIQQICTSASKALRAGALKKPTPPQIAHACDELSLTILRRVSQTGSANGAEIAAAALTNEKIRCGEDGAYHAACALASPTTCRYPLLVCPQVCLPEKPPAMWDAVFSLTEMGKLVLDGKVPNCLVNGYIGAEGKMPPLRARAVAEAIQLVASHHSDTPDAIESKLTEPDFPCPCIFEFHGAAGWCATGKGNITCTPNAEVSGNEVLVNMIPGSMEQEKTVEALREILEDVPGVEACEARGEAYPVPWYKIVIKCKNENSARSCLEAVLASSSLKSKVKVSYTVTDSEGHRFHSTPQEILRGFVASLLERGVDPNDVSKTLSGIDDGPRTRVRAIRASNTPGPYVLWLFDSSCRNRVLALPTIKKQSRGGKGNKASDSDIKLLVCGRTRERCALLNFAGVSSTVEIRQPDADESLVHPAESLPEGANGIVAGVAPGDKKFSVVVTSFGLIKKMDSADLVGGRKGSKVAAKTSGGDSVACIIGGNDEDDVVIVSAHGSAVRFKLKQVRSMGNAAKGVSGMTLGEGDRVAGAVCMSGQDGDKFSVFSSSGIGKTVQLDEVPLQNRGGKGVNLIEIDGGGRVVSVCHNLVGGDFIVGTRSGKIIRFSCEDVAPSRRGGGGVAVIDLDTEDAVTSAISLPSRDSEIVKTGAEALGGEEGAGDENSVQMESPVEQGN